MEFIKLQYDGQHYKNRKESNIEMAILGYFLTSDVGCYCPAFRKWALVDPGDCCSGNITILEKEDGYIYLSDMCSEENVPTKLKMTTKQFVQLLDDWENKVCKLRPAEVIIKYENDQFSIETVN